MEESAAKPTSQRFQVSLSRDLGLFDVTMIGVGAMIGAGIFGLTGIAAGEAGPVGLLLAFFLNGLVTSMTGAAYSQAADSDQIIIGASEERILEQSLFGSIPQRVAEDALCTVMMVKRHDPVKFGLRRWLMGPRKLSAPVNSTEQGNQQ